MIGKISLGPRLTIVLMIGLSITYFLDSLVNCLIYKMYACMHKLLVLSHKQSKIWRYLFYNDIKHRIADNWLSKFWLINFQSFFCGVMMVSTLLWDCVSAECQWHFNIWRFPYRWPITFIMLIVMVILSMNLLRRFWVSVCETNQTYRGFTFGHTHLGVSWVCGCCAKLATEQGIWLHPLNPVKLL